VPWWVGRGPVGRPPARRVRPLSAHADLVPRQAGGVPPPSCKFRVGICDSDIIVRCENTRWQTMYRDLLLSFLALHVVQLTLAQETIPNYTPPVQGNDYPGNDIAVTGQTGYVSGGIGFSQTTATACANVCDSITTSPKCLCFVYYSSGPLANKCYPKSTCPTSSNSLIPAGSTLYYYHSTAAGRSSASIAFPSLIFSSFVSIAAAVFITVKNT
jgi:hypothetical protein